MPSITQFNRSQRTSRTAILPERLQRLNRELAAEKTFDYLYAVHGKLRIRICVLRDVDNKFYATGTIAGKSFRIQGGSPSGAVYMLGMVMRRFFTSLPAAERERAMEAIDHTA